MEGVGSRQSRASSRYSSSPSAPIFNGPVRKWRKQWVSSRSSNQNNGSNRNDSAPLFLCRWTPIPSTAEEPRKRRCRYAPIVPIEKGSVESVEKGKGSSSEGRGGGASMLEKYQPGTGSGYTSAEETTQDLNEDQADSNKGSITPSGPGNATK